MLHIVLLILKIIGIVLACIIGVLLLLLCLILFVSVRYRGDVQFDGKPLYTFKAGWIPGVVSISFLSQNGKKRLCVRIFWFAIIDTAKEKIQKAPSKAPKKEKAKKSEPKEKVSVESEFEKVEAEEQSGTKTQKVVQAPKPPEIADQSQTKNEAEENDHTKKYKRSAKKQSLKEKINHLKTKILGIKDTVLEKLNKIKETFENISEKKDKLFNILFSDSGEQSILHLKLHVFKLLDHVRPRKIKGNILFGTGDAYSTARVLSIVALMYPIIDKQWQVTPDFQEKVIEGHLSFKGRIRLVRVLLIVLKVVINKNNRNTFKALRNM